jgi:hypothetical protein
MATRFVFGPTSTDLVTSLPAYEGEVQRRPVIVYDEVGFRQSVWTAIAPSGLLFPLTVVLHGIMASATSGAVALFAQAEAITPGDALNLLDTQSFGAAGSAIQNVPATAGVEFAATIDLGVADSMVDGDLIRFTISRNSSNASDTASGAYYLLAAEFRDSA